ncbi:hypothetical protein BKA63DRAFT_250717 [Paraphoma chrysanthemicola]|nr:hypothetical protein BKA63DRAFT_250717 [Paraphoma chrysanthemicola]
MGRCRYDTVPPIVSIPPQCDVDYSTSPSAVQPNPRRQATKTGCTTLFSVALCTVRDGFSALSITRSAMPIHLSIYTCVETISVSLNLGPCWTFTRLGQTQTRGSILILGVATNAKSKSALHEVLRHTQFPGVLGPTQRAIDGRTYPARRYARFQKLNVLSVSLGSFDPKNANDIVTSPHPGLRTGALHLNVTCAAQTSLHIPNAHGQY